MRENKREQEREKREKQHRHNSGGKDTKRERE